MQHRSLPIQVKEYYNQMTASYLENYGDVIQAFRPSDTEKLLDYVGRSAGLNWKLKVLDLGCGVGGPAIHFAKRWNVQIDAVTISDVQFNEAQKKVEIAQLAENISLYVGDYHHLENLTIQDNFYDVVLFLESLGHSNDVVLAIKNACKKLKVGGVLYIKDFYKRVVNNTSEQQKIDAAIDNIDKYYCYNTLSLEQLKTTLLLNNFTIEFIKTFDFVDDIQVRKKFEQANNIDIFEGKPKFYPADWLEIKCIKNIS